MPPGLIESIGALGSKRVVLASQSPQRATLLRQVVPGIAIHPSTFAEDLPKGSDAAGYARRTATEKATEVAEHLGPAAYDLVIGADTVVECGGEVLEKPQGAEDARRMLRMLSGSTHKVHTGLALCTPPREPGGRAEVHSCAESTSVSMAALTEGDIDLYIQSGEPFGKAGAYGIQGTASLWVSRLEGCYFNVVGFPLAAFARQVAQLAEERGWC